MDEKVRIVFDVDDTICSNVRRTGYENSKPKQDVVDKINYLHDKLGFCIVLYTARGMVSCEGNMERIILKNKKILEDWLKKHNVHYDELVFGKPIADVYVDDRCLDVEEFCNNDFEVLKGGGSGKSIYRLGKLVKKMFASEKETSEFKDWVEDNKGYCLYPEVVSYLYDAVYMKFIDGKNLSTCMSKYDFFKMINIISDFSKVKFDSFDLNIQLDVLRKNKGFDEDVDYMIDICERFLKDNESVLIENASFSHGDAIMSNIMKENKSGNLYFVDPRYFRESSSYLLDYAKFRMSISGYEFVFKISDSFPSPMFLDVFDKILKLKGIFEIVVGLHLMYVLRLYRYKDDEGRSVVKRMAKGVLEQNEELFRRYKEE